MKILNNEYQIIEIFSNIITIPDCIVVKNNKLGKGHGESKLYFGTKAEMREFYGSKGFNVKCFILKQDLIKYMETIKEEYLNPSQPYIGKEKMPNLWHNRMEIIKSLDEIIEFYVKDQTQIAGTRGYLNSSDEGYQIIREISLPLVSYISAMELKSNNGEKLFYWKLFADFEAIWEKRNTPQVFNYGKKNNQLSAISTIKNNKKNQEIKKSRIGQGIYREKLLEECPYCPITMINDERLLIASHIKPWVLSNDKEKIDPKNGYILSPLYDKLFDKGFITFTSERKMLVSNWFTPQNQKRMGLKNETFIQNLPMDKERINYLEFHKKNIFKG